MPHDAPGEDADERLRERWFGPLIDAEPEEVAAALVAAGRRSGDHPPDRTARLSGGGLTRSPGVVGGG